ncbi:hypothetical protein ACE6H2_026467 [Prunus campanulata]
MDRPQPLEKEKVESEHKKEKVESERNKLYEISQKQENRVRNLETSMMQLVFAYVFFQGVIFVSIFPHPNVSCDYWWIPFSLSCLIFVIFAIPFKCYVRNWELTKYYHEMNFLQQDLLHQTIIILSSLEPNMSSSEQSQLTEQPDRPSPAQPCPAQPAPEYLARSPMQSQLTEQPDRPSPAQPSPQPAPESLARSPMQSQLTEQPDRPSTAQPARESPAWSPMQSQEILKSDTARGNRRKAFIYMVSLALVAYTILILKACQSIPCHRDATP